MLLPPQIIKSRQASEMLDAFRKSLDKHLELEKMVDWTLQHAPTRFPLIDPRGYRLWTFEKDFPLFPVLEILYHYSEETHVVEVVRIRVLVDE